MSVIYREDIGFNGVLKIEENSFYILYSFIGPDVRYSGVNVVIKGDEIDDYIKAWELNFSQYMDIRVKNKGKYIEEKALKGMTIKTGALVEGVCLIGNHLPISSRRKLDKVIKTLNDAKKTASEKIRENKLNVNDRFL